MSASEPQPIPRFAAFQYHDFRALWLGQLVSLLGTQMQNFAVNWQVYELLKNSSVPVNVFGNNINLGGAALGLGAVGLVRVVPILCFAVLGGVMADSRNRRTILGVTQTLAAIIAGLLALVSISGIVSVPLIYLLSAMLSATMAFANPARQALVPNLVPREHLTNALSLSTTAMTLGQVLGPALGGAILAVANPGWVYAFNALSFLAVLVAVLVMRHPGTAPANAATISFASMLEGFRFVRRTPIIWSTMLLDFAATFFSSASTMLPIYASEILHIDKFWAGVLGAGQAVGSVIASVILSLQRSIKRQGPVIIAAVIVYGAATVLFGLSTNFVLSYITYAITGAADAVSTVIRGTARQLHTPDHLRGRMMGVNMMFFMGGPQLGELEAGAVTAAIGVSGSIVSGGLLTILMAIWIARRFPVLRQYRSLAGA